MVVRAEFPILFLHLKMLFSAQCPLSLPCLQSAGRQAVWGTRGAPSTRQFMFISPRGELTAAAPEFEDAAGAWSPLHAGRAERHK